MKRYLTTILALFAAVFSYAQTDSTAGEKLFQEASEYVFSGRKLDLVITSLDKKGNPYYNGGFFVALPDRGYMEIEGVSQFQYTEKLVTSYNYQTNEYIIQPRKTTSSSVSDNPFSILSKSNKGISVSEPKAGDVKGVACTKISVTPQGKAYYKRADVYVSGSPAKVLRITIVIKKDQAFVVDVVKAGAAEPEKVGDYRLLISDHPGAEKVDLRD
ncbi:MAG: hypothetical protein J6X91_05030 [Bacteroidales bacterium]|nr:hypothetical protein [Bacteroidales bacterium]MBP5518002.1 hypothetical protein [Bacteroidales bacterium]